MCEMVYIARAFVLICFALGANCGETRIVETNNGLVRGTAETTFLNNVHFFAFRGIPYAKPPIGDLRLKAPEPADSWKPNVLDALNYSNICIQPTDFWRDPNPQSEDCLYLNVFVPADRKPNDKLAVLFFIHGGGYGEGSGSDFIFGPDMLVEKDVVLVTSNYRLGALGFFSLDLPEYSGNMGMKDQQLALKWTHENIAHFGGDSDRITIFGQSAGSASVHLHVLSAESRKYFNNAIAMSGSANHHWGLSSRPNHIEAAFEMAKLAGRPKGDLPELIDWLKTVPADRFADHSKLAPNTERTFAIANAPVVEIPNAVRPFMVESLEALYGKYNADKDVMFGITSEECVALKSMNEHIDRTDDLDQSFDLTLPFKGINLPFDSPKYRELAADIRKFYFKDAPVSSNVAKYVTLLSDINFAYHAHKAAVGHAQKSTGNTFYYHFDVDSTLNVFKQQLGDANSQGASHCDELCYLFRCGFAPKFYDQVFENQSDEAARTSLQAIERFTKLFTNFAKYGQPLHGEQIGELRPFADGKWHYVDINNDGFALKQDLSKAMVDFWSSIEQRALKYSAAHEEL